MNKEKLLEELEAYHSTVSSKFQEFSSKPATVGDIAELARQTYYVLSAIIESLD